MQMRTFQIASVTEVQRVSKENGLNNVYHGELLVSTWKLQVTQRLEDLWPSTCSFKELLWPCDNFVFSRLCERAF